MKAPPLFVSYQSPDDSVEESLKIFLSSLTPDLQEKFGKEITILGEKKLPPVVSMRCLGVLFGYSPHFIYAMANNNRKYYRQFTIKSGKKIRRIQAPRVAIKVIQKWFGFHLAKSLIFNDYVFGFVEGRSAVDAAAKHCGSKWVYSVDIKDFFPSTRKEKVITELNKLGYSLHGATLITNLCCYGNSLGQGAPSSPVLSNLVMRPIDTQLKTLADELRITFTRYADDIVFSGNERFPEELKDYVSKVFEGTGWKLATSKTYEANVEKGERLKVHGLLVHGDKPRLTKGYRNRIRAYKHLWNGNKIKLKDKNKIEGHISFAASVDNHGF